MWYIKYTSHIHCGSSKIFHADSRHSSGDAPERRMNISGISAQLCSHTATSLKPNKSFSWLLFWEVVYIWTLRDIVNDIQVKDWEAELPLTTLVLVSAPYCALSVKCYWLPTHDSKHQQWVSQLMKVCLLDLGGHVSLSLLFFMRFFFLSNMTWFADTRR